MEEARGATGSYEDVVADAVSRATDAPVSCRPLPERGRPPTGEGVAPGLAPVRADVLEARSASDAFDTGSDTAGCDGFACVAAGSGAGLAAGSGAGAAAGVGGAGPATGAPGGGAGVGDGLGGGLGGGLGDGAGSGAGEGAGAGDGSGAGGGAGGGDAAREGSRPSGSTYFSSSPTRTPRCTYGVSCSASPDGPGSATGSPSPTWAPRLTRSVPRCVSEAL